jgi:TM2 domain-containing membrane protein YozV/ribosomal protein L40E
MAIQVACICGKRLKAPDSLAGKNAKCPACGTLVPVPTLDDEPVIEFDAPDAPPVESKATAAPTKPTKGSDEKFCHECGATIRAKAEICPRCGVRQPETPFEHPMPTTFYESPAYRDAGSKKTAAGLCGILLGALGIHKFILGRTLEGAIMLAVSIGGAFCTFGASALVMGIIGLVEGIIYLSKNDRQFYQTYIVHKRGWF